MEKKRREDVARAPVAECSLPGHPHALTFGSIAEFEAHYYAEHAFRCSAPVHGGATAATTLAARRRAEESAPRCGMTFPSAHLLALHADECHSMLTAQRKERGEKTFACFEPLCERMFATPKLRRQHLIAAHHYPPEFFFSITNHGIGRLRELYGDSASLVRKTWKPRGDTEGNERVNNKQGDTDQGEKDVADVEKAGQAQEAVLLPRPEASAPRQGQLPTPSDPIPPATAPSKKRMLDSPPRLPSPEPAPPTPAAPSLNVMLEQMSALSLVPRNVRRGK